MSLAKRVFYPVALGLAIVLTAAITFVISQKNSSAPAAPPSRDSESAPAAPAPREDAPAPAGDEASFLKENDAAMAKMMTDMCVKPTGDVDRDFVAMMAPHHRGAIDMAKAVLRFGKNEQVRRLAQEIIVTQQQEIAAMRLAVGDPLPPSAAAPTTAANDPAARPPEGHEHMHTGHEGR
jgi:hypothetical protein